MFPEADMPFDKGRSELQFNMGVDEGKGAFDFGAAFTFFLGPSTR